MKKSSKNLFFSFPNDFTLFNHNFDKSMFNYFSIILHFPQLTRHLIDSIGEDCYDFEISADTKIGFSIYHYSKAIMIKILGFGVTIVRQWSY